MPPPGIIGLLAERHHPPQPSLAIAAAYRNTANRNIPANRQPPALPKAAEKPPFAKGGLGGLPSPPQTNPGENRQFRHRPHRHSGAGRNPEPRLIPDCGKAGDVDSCFRGNDGGGGNDVV